MKKRLALRSFRLQNFKAVRDSGTVAFGPLTVFIGNNGSGKSSLVEGLETFRDINCDGLDAAMTRWRGFEHVWNQATPQVMAPKLPDGRSLMKQALLDVFVEGWQFLNLAPDAMGQPTPQQRAAGRIRLARNGANLAEYLNDIRGRDQAAFRGVVELLQYVLPFAADLEPTLASELQREFYLKVKEEEFEVPGWLLSTGTLRILALVACLRHPDPPPLLVVEEVENGLDPRTISLLVEEIRAAIDEGKTQVILTTHSPYLLDLLDLSHIVVVERVDGQPTFTRPDKKALAKWAESFAPAKLYTMGRLTPSRGS